MCQRCDIVVSKELERFDEVEDEVVVAVLALRAADNLPHFSSTSSNSFSTLSLYHFLTAGPLQYGPIPNAIEIGSVSSALHLMQLSGVMATISLGSVPAVRCVNIQ